MGRHWHWVDMLRSSKSLIIDIDLFPRKRVKLGSNFPSFSRGFTIKIALYSSYIRPVKASEDDAALSRICLLTGAAGKSAEPYHAHPELLGLIFALPYNHQFNNDVTFGFVLVDDSPAESGAVDDYPQPSDENILSQNASSGGEVVVGYILGTTDSVLLRELEGKEWWPALREKYPLEGEDEAGAVLARGRTRADSRLIKVLHSPYVDPPSITDPYPAHIHIDILPSHQRQGHGRKLMASAVEYLRSRGHRGLFVGLDPANEEAKKFYGRLGFQRRDEEGGEWWTLDFERFAS